MFGWKRPPSGRSVFLAASVAAALALVVSACGGWTPTPTPVEAPSPTPAPVAASFGADVTRGAVPLTVQFTDRSSNAVAWAWDFGDSSPISADRNPFHTYLSPGVYDVTLTVTGPGGAYTVTRQGLIVAGVAVVELPSLTRAIAGQPTILVTMDSNVVRVGRKASLSLRLSEAPAGLSGFDVEVTIGDPAVAQVSKVTYPDFGLVQTLPETLPASTVRVRGVDLNQLVSAGATDVELATIKVTVLSAGVTRIDIVARQVDDDQGNPISPAVAPSSITSDALEVQASFVVGLQGRDSLSGPGWVTANEVTFYSPEADPYTKPPLYTFNVSSDETGTFQVLLPPGVYDVRAKGAHTLRVLKPSVDLTTGGSIDLGVQRGGGLQQR